MSAITTCPRCGRCYFAASEEAANEPDRECYSCWEGSKPAEDGAPDGDRASDDGTPAEGLD